MPQTIALIDTLKRTLKAQGKTYADVADALELSEASVKRLFSERSFSLQRLDRVCEFLGIEISDLVRSMENSSGEITELTEEQEKELAADINLLLTAQLLLNKWTFKEIIGTYQIEELEGVRLLAKLDRMKLIELLPGNRVKLKISRHFSWRPHGPIQQFFEQQVQNEFLQSRFNKNGESRLFLSGMLSRRSNAEIQRRMQRLAAEFHALVAEDESIPLNDKFGTAFVMAIRPWEPQSFTRLRREPSTKKF
ncbi:protein containing HTH domain [Hahella chejuensis KCTC 2396]|uniref:Protein containing HTH domain n=1 Tax=Hahella chejuensis (strain KCTC 2396) TaxID=349521 RepID=Q2SQH7_HAHCH|nr:helix-turn-helix transcriptional regulator [Hahella chejuensis]ABC27097.1 protein containing HTH domain [Hahella chejuensis KCTC 2396]